MKLSNLILSGLATALLATSANAAIHNTRPVSVGSAPAGEQSLQTIMNNMLDPDTINVANNQNTAAIWSHSEVDTDAYFVTSYAGHQGELGVYSYANPSKTAILMNNPSTNAKAGFEILAGDLYVNNTLTVSGFGNLFGFFWHDTSDDSYSFTEDSQNGETALALSYLVSAGTKVTFGSRTSYAKGNDDWILAFEDNETSGSDRDFNDAVFYIEDMEVSAPATLALMGLGLLGMGMRARRRS